MAKHINRRSFVLGGTTAAFSILVAACAPRPVAPRTTAVPAPSTRPPDVGTASPAVPATATRLPANPTAAPSATAPVVASPTPAVVASPLRAAGAKLVDATGQEFHITGINWFGLETDTFAPHGLWARNVDDMLDQIAATGFNTIRLPFSNQLFDAASKPNRVSYQLNPQLQGLGGPEIMDYVIRGAGKRHLRIILDRHRPTADAQSELWYTDKVNEDRWIQDWVMLAKKYRGNPTVIGADLHNEPHGPATWGDGNVGTDWRLAAERGGKAVLEANPDWLILVQGIEHYDNQWYWWGGNLMGAKENPVRLPSPDKLVYSPHDYGPEIYAQQWFKDPSFPNNLPNVWKKQWAYLQLNNVAPVHVGEFGGRSVGQDPAGMWQRTLLNFLKDNQMSYTYWSWNPDSGDTGGILQEDWLTVDRAKLQLLSAYQWPRPDQMSLSPQQRATQVALAYQWPPAGTPTHAPSG